MADPVWPFQCPSSWSEKARTATLRSEVEAGAPKARARFTKSYREITAGWIFEKWSDLTTFSNFFKVDLNDGANTFTMKHPMTGETLRVRFKDSPTIQSDTSKKPSFTMEASLEEMLT